VKLVTDEENFKKGDFLGREGIFFRPDGAWGALVVGVPRAAPWAIFWCLMGLRGLEIEDC